MPRDTSSLSICTGLRLRALRIKYFHIEGEFAFFFFLYLFLMKIQRLPHWKETQVRTNYVKSYTPGTSLAVQRLRLYAPSAGGMGSTPGWGTKPCMPKGVAKKNLV